MTDQRAEGVGSLFPHAAYAYAAAAPAGAVLFTAGACPLDVAGNVIGLGDPVAEAGSALDNLITTLDLFGARPKNLIKTTVYVVGDRTELTAVWTVVADRLLPFRPPSTLLGVSALGYPGQLVEIEGIAALHNVEVKGNRKRPS